MKVRCTVLTHRGIKRSSNEDCTICGGWVRTGSLDRPHTFEVDVQVTALFAVADGLGGQAAGEVASLIGLARLDALTSHSHAIDEPQVLRALEEVHAGLLEMSQSSAELRGMGTTVAGAFVSGAGVLVFNVGDSRVYRREDRYLQQLSRDDRLFQAGYGEAAAQGSSSGLLQYLGVPSTKIEPHVTTLAPASQTETFLICTDGLHDYVSLDDIEGAMSGDHQNWLRALFSKACGAGGGDNISMLVLEVSRMGSGSTP